MESKPGDSQKSRETTTDALAAQGEASFLQLYEKLAPALLVWATVRIPKNLNRYLSHEDVVQEVWFQTSRSLATFDPSRGSFRAWMFRVAKNVLLQAFRRLRRPDVLQRLKESGSSLWALENVPAQVTSISRKCTRNESLQMVTAFLMKLERVDRELIVHCGLEDMSHAAVAPLLGLTKEAVHKRWQRLRARLADQGLPEELLVDPR